MQVNANGWEGTRGYGEASAGGKNVEARRTGGCDQSYVSHVRYHGPGRSPHRATRPRFIDSALRRDGTARRVPRKGPGTGSGRVERRAAVLPGFVYFVSIHTVPPVPRGPVGKVYRDVTEARKVLIVFKTIRVGKGLREDPPRGIDDLFMGGDGGAR